METNTAIPTSTNKLSQAARALSTVIVAGAFAVMLAFGAPDAESSRWDDNIDAHSEVSFDIALDAGVQPGE